MTVTSKKDLVKKDYFPAMPGLTRWTSMSPLQIKKVLKSVEKQLEYKKQKKTGLDLVLIGKMETILKSISRKDISKANLKQKVSAFSDLHDRVFPKQPTMLQQVNVEGMKVTMPSYFRPQQRREGAIETMLAEEKD